MVTVTDTAMDTVMSTDMGMVMVTGSVITNPEITLRVILSIAKNLS